ncbi:MAG: hypothetical protein AVDCRST_MAG77-6019, partial [uncultured Chloroflexi bacterium]
GRARRGAGDRLRLRAARGPGAGVRPLRRPGPRVPGPRRAAGVGVPRCRGRCVRVAAGTPAVRGRVAAGRRLLPGAPRGDAKKRARNRRDAGRARGGRAGQGGSTSAPGVARGERRGDAGLAHWLLARHPGGRRVPDDRGDVLRKHVAGGLPVPAKRSGDGGGGGQNAVPARAGGPGVLGPQDRHRGRRRHPGAVRRAAPAGPRGRRRYPRRLDAAGGGPAAASRSVGATL